MLLAACVPAGDDDDSSGAPPSAPDGISFGPLIACEEPDEGLGAFTESAAARGLDFAPEVTQAVFSYALSGVVATDLDADDDPDLIFGSLMDAPPVYRNDGAGGFERVPQDWAVEDKGRLVVRQAAVDLDDDGLPDLVLSGEGRIWSARNLGDLRFDAPRELYTTGSVDRRVQGSTFGSMTWGDVDGDGDLDAVATSIFPRAETDDDDPAAASHDLLLINDGDGDLTGTPLLPDVPKAMAVVAMFLDVDADDDLDLLLASHRGPAASPTRMLIQQGVGDDGSPAFVDRAEELGLATLLSPMGIDAVDLDGDGLLDLCMTDTGPVACYLAVGGGVFADVTTTIGLSTDQGRDWSGWGIDVVDLDNDGTLDAVAAGAPANLAQGADPDHPDALWEGVPGTGEFTLREGGPFAADLAPNYGVAAADFDRDGRLEVVIAGIDGPRLYAAGCASGAWTSVRLVGASPNRGAVGAVVTVEAGGRTSVRSVQTVRGPSQGPAELHFGLGDAETIDRLKIDWPDGETTEYVEIDVRRRITATR